MLINTTILTTFIKNCISNTIYNVRIMLNVEDMNSDKIKNSFLHFCKNGFYDLVKLFIEYNIDLEHTDDENNTGYILACKHNHTNIIELLLNHKINIEHKDRYDNTSIQWICYNNNVEILKLLISKGANLNNVNYEGYTGFMFACMYNHLDIIKLLLENNVNTDYVSKDKCNTGFICACIYKRYEVIHYLLDKVDLRLINKEMNTGLMILFDKHDFVLKYVETLNLLFNNKIDDSKIFYIYAHTFTAHNKRLKNCLFKFKSIDKNSIFRDLLHLIKLKSNHSNNDEKINHILNKPEIFNKIIECKLYDIFKYYYDINKLSNEQIDVLMEKCNNNIHEYKKFDERINKLNNLCFDNINNDIIIELINQKFNKIKVNMNENHTLMELYNRIKNIKH